ncbi:MAG: TlpA family protein disulfide reductase [Nitrospirae bacterium]|nr:TlpA family protein disulfide reductase [Nitrospirota bacterium]
MNSLKRTLVFITLSILIISFVSCKKAVETGPAVVDNMAPDFTLRDISGNTIALSAYRGKVVMVEFWATWCPPCKELVPVLEGLYEKYKDRGFVILALVSEDDGKDAIESFINEYKVTYTVVLANNEVIRRYGISSIPISFIINKEGKIVNRHIGNSPDIMQELTTDIEGLL